MHTSAEQFSQASVESRVEPEEEGLSDRTARARCIEFESLLAREMPRFHRMAMRWLHNREDAEDAVQDAMMSAFVHIASFEGRARMSSWLMSIVINSVKMHLRRNRRKMFPLDQALDGDARTLAELLPDPSPSPEQSCEVSQIREMVYQSISHLSPTQRAALRLFNREGLSLKEAAEVLGVPIGTVKAQLARGRGELTQRLRRVLVGSETRKSRVDSRTKQSSAHKPSPEGSEFKVASPSSPRSGRWAAKAEPEFSRNTGIHGEVCFGLSEVAVEGYPVPA